MPIAIAVVLGMAVIAVTLIGVLWTLVFFVPYYAWVAIAAYLFWRRKRTDDALRRSMHEDSERQRTFNELEMRAWRASIETERRNDERRYRVLRSIEKSRRLPKP